MKPSEKTVRRKRTLTYDVDEDCIKSEEHGATTSDPEKEL